MSMTEPVKPAITGGCACGKLRFAASAPPIDVAYCHCKICQRTTGAPVLAFASFLVGDFRYTAGTPAVYYSSDVGERRFCASCGTQIEYRDRVNPPYAEVNVGALDHPENFPPQFHIFDASRIAWLHIDDKLPRYAATEPDTT
jgi:hypothetical protein